MRYKNALRILWHNHLVSPGTGSVFPSIPHTNYMNFLMDRNTTVVKLLLWLLWSLLMSL